MNTDVMFSSKTDLWETPQELFDELDREFHFALDTCALPENAKCARYYTPEQDGLSQPWKGVCWCNPPYGRGIGRWVEKVLRQRGGWRNGGNADSCANRYEVVSRLHTWEGRDPFCAWEAEIWREQKQCTVPVNGGCVSAGIRRRFEKWNISVLRFPQHCLRPCR